MRAIQFERNYVLHPAGSCLASFGDTRVLCTATIESDLPPFLRDGTKGWVTAEYAMLPGSTGGGRKRREIGKKDGRGTEIQRLIGRCLRTAVDLDKLGPVSIILDCDVIQADGGTRTTAISGSWVALYDALRIIAKEQEQSGPEYYLNGQLGAVSVGIVDGEVICDLNYKQDSGAEVDMNVVKLNERYAEIQGTGEESTFGKGELLSLLEAADEGIKLIFEAQKAALTIEY
jgi:ribonuclease PH